MVLKVRLRNFCFSFLFNVVRLTLIVKMSRDVGLYKKSVWRKQQQQQFFSPLSNDSATINNQRLIYWWDRLAQDASRDVFGRNNFMGFLNLPK
jgi:hypothetical protein